VTGSDRLAAARESDGDRIRVLFLNTRSALGADVAVHLSLIQNLDRRVVDVFAVTNRNSEDLPATLDALKCLPEGRLVVADLGHEVSTPNRGKVARLSAAARNGAALVTIARVAGMIKKERIDLIHSTDRPRDALFATLLAKLTGRRNIVHAHIGWSAHFGRSTRWALDRCSAVLAISEFTRRSFERAGFPAARLRMAHNATDASRFDPGNVPAGAFRARLGIGPDTPLVGIVARVMLWKGHLELVEAIAKVRQTVPDVHLAIVGKEDALAVGQGADFAARLRQRVEELGLADCVHWAGWCDDVPVVMRDLDVLAAPSWEEPFGLAVTEALAMETPVVGFAAGALPEIVTNGVEGILVPPRRAEALAGALSQLLCAPEMRAAMGARGRKRVIEAFAPAKQAAEVAAIYKSILNRN
jgi:glycosyltransferase involved in cell wall biosynthesis